MLAGLVALAGRCGLPVVATNNVHFLRPEEHRIHRILSAIRTNRTVGTLPPGEVEHEGCWLRSPGEMAALFDDAQVALLVARLHEAPSPAGDLGDLFGTEGVDDRVQGVLRDPDLGQGLQQRVAHGDSALVGLLPFNGSGRVAFTKGAADGLLALSARVWTGGRLEPLTDALQAGVLRCLRPGSPAMRALERG